MEEIYKNLSLENLENEIWRNIEGYECLYQVSSYGRVKSLRDKYGNYREKILSQCDNGNGYLQVNLCKDKKMKTCYVHRLVAIAFIPNPNNYPTVNHNNEIKTDNRVCNLCWMDYSQQQRHGTCIQRRVDSTDWKAFGKKTAERCSKQVYQYSLDGILVAIWESASECGRNSFDKSAVSKCCNNCFNREGNNIYKDFIWSYYPL